MKSNSSIQLPNPEDLKPVERPPLDSCGLYPRESIELIDPEDEDFTFHQTQVHFAKGEDPRPFIDRMLSEGRHVCSVSIAGPQCRDACGLADKLNAEGYPAHEINSVFMRLKGDLDPELCALIEFDREFESIPQEDYRRRENEIRQRWGLAPVC